MPRIRTRQDDIFDRVIALAKKSQMTQKHGAIIVKDGKIIAEGYNYVTSFMSHSFSMHAEVDCLMKVKSKSKKFLEDCTLIVVRVGVASKGFPTKMSKPCMNCKAEIEKFGIKKVFYSTEVQ